MMQQLKTVRALLQELNANVVQEFGLMFQETNGQQDIVQVALIGILMILIR